jgi:hypothetical protein
MRRGRQALEAAAGRLQAGVDFGVTLTPAECALLWEHIRTERWRTKCRRKHIEDLMRDAVREPDEGD